MKRNGKTRAGGEEEAALYGPIKGFFEARGYMVKGEVRGCDLVACKPGEPPVIVELKLRFSLPLLLQGIDRLALSERVYLAVPRPQRSFRGIKPEASVVRRLCRRIGLGLIVVGSRDSVAVVEEPVPYRPRPARERTVRLLGEFERRVGDPNVGGRTRAPIVTAYRQDALRLAAALATIGDDGTSVRALRVKSGVVDAGRILYRNVYGWFVPRGRGCYALTEDGRAVLVEFADAVAALSVGVAA